MRDDRQWRDRNMIGAELTTTLLLQTVGYQFQRHGPD